MRGLCPLLLAALVLLALACAEEAAPPTPTPTPTAAAPLAPGQVRITYYGHAMFTIESPGGIVILTDPNKGIGYRVPTGRIDVVTASHLHFDHLPKAQVAPGARFIGGLRSADRHLFVCAAIDETIGDVRIRTACTFHDDKQGAERGENAMFLFDVAGLRILHTGDLGHQLTLAHCCVDGPIDVLLVPVGGFFTIDPVEVDQVVQFINPKVIIPMHYRTNALRHFPDADQLAPVDDFLEGKANVRRQGSSSIVIGPELPEEPLIVVLDYQRE